MYIFIFLDAKNWFLKDLKFLIFQKFQIFNYFFQICCPTWAQGPGPTWANGPPGPVFPGWISSFGEPNFWKKQNIGFLIINVYFYVSTTDKFYCAENMFIKIIHAIDSFYKSRQLVLIQLYR